MLQALADPQEYVVEQALRSLASMAEMGLLQRAKLWELIDTIARFEMHPNVWIREAATHFISAATTFLSLADTRVLVAPLVKPYLKVPASDFDETELLDALMKPMPRTVLDLAMQWASQADRSIFWKHAKETKLLPYQASGQMPPTSSVASFGPKSLGRIPKTDEDEQWLGRLRNAGMKSEDEFKILAFMAYLWRTAQRSKKDGAASVDSVYDQMVSLTKLDVNLQTVIFEADVDLYCKRKQDRTQVDRPIEDALKEAAASEASAESSHQYLNGVTSSPRGVSAPAKEKDRTGPPRLPDLRREHSGSGQSLSSSPSSGTGLLGSVNGNATRNRSNAKSLLNGGNLRAKTHAEVATDDATAAGRLNIPTVSQRRASSSTNAAQTRNNSLKPTPTRAGHNYAGNDPTVLNLLDTVYLDTFPMDTADFGPIVQPLHHGSIPSSTKQTSVTPWRPRGQLIAILGEHFDRITRMVVSPDHAFFVTGCDDGFVKVWDASRMERNITHRARYSQSLGKGVKVTSICFIESTHSFVCMGSDGSVHFFRVSVVDGENGPQFAGRMQLLRTWELPDTSSAGEYVTWSDHFRSESGSILVLAMNMGRVLAVDLRYMTVVTTFENPAQHGTPLCFCIGRRHDWILIGTSHGVLDLWDLRFKLRLRSWAFPGACPVTRLQLHPSRKSARRNRVCISGGSARGEVTVWDLEKVICHEVLRPSNVHSIDQLNAQDYELRNLDEDRSESLLDRISGTDTEATTASAVATPMVFGVYQVSEDSEAQHPYVVTGGPDNKVRFWDCNRLEGCRLVSGGVLDEKPSYAYSNLTLDTRVIAEKMPDRTSQPTDTIESSRISSKSASKRGVQIGAGGKPQRYEMIRLSAQHLLNGHLDTITDVALLERPFGMVLSADKSGQIFVHQ